MGTKLVQARIDEAVRDRASLVLDRWGLTISDAVRILLTRTAHEGSPPMELVSSSKEHDDWFRQHVQQALDANDYVSEFEAKTQFARQRSRLKAQQKLQLKRDAAA